MKVDATTFLGRGVFPSKRRRERSIELPRVANGLDDRSVEEISGQDNGLSKGATFGICSIALFMASIDSTIVATVLTTIDRDLHATINWTGWVLTIYQLGSILAMPLAGKISDQFGRRRVFVFSVVIFTAASVLCGFAGNIYELIAFRALQAIGGGAIMPAATGIVSDRFGKDRDRGLGMFTSIFPLGGIVGPIFGGLFVTFWTWRGIFFINIPLGILVIALTLKFIPDSRTTPSSRTDLRGVALLGFGILSAMFGITMLGSKGASWTSPLVVVPIVVAAGLIYLFLRHTGRIEAPFIPMQLLRGKGFATMNLLNFIYGATALGFGALVPLYAIERFGISRLDSGTLLTARAIGMILVAALATMMLRRTGYRYPMVAGFFGAAVGVLWMSFAPPGMSPYLWLTLAAGFTGLGMGVAAPATNNASMQLAPDMVAAIAGLRGMFRQSGGIFAVAVATALLNRSPDPGLVLAHIFWVLAGVLVVVAIPLIFAVPDFKGTW